MVNEWHIVLNGQNKICWCGVRDGMGGRWRSKRRGRSLSLKKGITRSIMKTNWSVMGLAATLPLFHSIWPRFFFPLFSLLFTSIVVFLSGQDHKRSLRSSIPLQLTGFTGQWSVNNTTTSELTCLLASCCQYATRSNCCSFKPHLEDCK